MTDEEYVSMMVGRAESGDPDAQCSVGSWYVLGEYVGKDFDMAKFWYNCAIERGSKDGAMLMADMYLHDFNDHEKAIAYFLKSDLSNYKVLLNLGLCYGALRRYGQAIVYLQKANNIKPREDIAQLIKNAKAQLSNLMDTPSSVSNCTEQSGVSAGASLVKGLGSIFFGGMGGSSAPTSQKEKIKEFSKSEAVVVLEGIHRYILKSNGQRIGLSEYDNFSGVGKGFDGKMYKVKGGGAVYK